MQTNTDTVLGIYEALARQDFAATLQVTDPEVTVSQTDALPWGGEFQGFKGLKTFMSHLLQHVQSTVEPRETFEAGDQVVVVGYTVGKTVTNETPFCVRAVHVWTLREGRVVRFEPYIDTPAMRRVLGHRLTGHRGP